MYNSSRRTWCQHLRWIVIYTVRYVSGCAYRRDHQAQAYAQCEAQVPGTIDLAGSLSI